MMKESYRVLISDAIAEAAYEIFSQWDEIEVVTKTSLSSEELLEEISDYHGIIVRSGTTLNKEVLARAENLKVIGRAGIGVDNIDVKEATRRGIVVMNTPDSSAITTAEHAISLMLSAIRNIPQGTASLKEGRWDKKALTGRELYGKTLGIIGLGNIGRQVASRAQGLGLKVMAYDPYTAKKKAQELNVELVEIEELFREADIFTCHTPLTKATRNLIDQEAMDKMKEGVYIVNCARGGIVNEKDLVRALESGKVAGAAFDVFVEEPPGADHPLLALENFVCTPHLGASTSEAQQGIARAISQQISRFLLTEEVKNALNFPSVPSEMKDLLMPYLELGEKLGKMIGQLVQKKWNTLHITYEGKVARLSTHHITLAIQKGLLENHHQDTLNYINAPFLLESHGIETVESRQESHDFTSALRVTLKNGEYSSTIRGVLSHKGDPRIVQVDDFELEVVPEGAVLVIKNLDRPGVIGQLGSLLGKNEINISRMQLALDEEEDQAMSMWNIDPATSEEVLEEIRHIDHILKATQVII